MTAYQLKLILAGQKPEVWRRVNVPSTATFDQLHQVIQAAMFWDNCHLYYFELPLHGIRLCRNVNELISCEEDGPGGRNGQNGKNFQRFRTLHAGGKRLKDLLEPAEEFCYRYECTLGRELRILVEDQLEVSMFYGSHCVEGEEGFDLLAAENKVRSLVMDYTQEMFHIRELRGAMDALISSLALAGPTMTSLFDILSALPEKRLRDLTESFDLTEARGLERPLLEGLVAKELLDENYVCYHGIYTGERGLNLMEIAALGEVIPYEQAYCADLMPLIVGGLLYPFRGPEGIGFIMPEEMGELFLELEEDDLFWEDRYQEQDFSRFFKAAANLYGSVPVYELARIYNEYVPADYETDEEEILDMIDTFAGYNLCEYVMRGGYLSSMQVELEKDLKERIAGRRKGEALYLPKTREELDRFAKGNYYEWTTAHLRMKQFIMEKMGEDNEGADSLLDLLNHFMRINRRPEEIFEIFEGYSVSIASEEEINRMFEVLLDLRQQTRLWELGGFMETELKERREERGSEGKVISLITRKPIGDRDPCPCGSGKAFADCCGTKEKKEK